MTCEEFERKLDMLLEEELPAEASDEMREHVASCTACEQLFDLSRAVRDSLAEELPLPEGFSERVMEAVRAEKAAPPVRKRRFYPMPFTAVAAAAVALMFGINSGAFSSILHAGRSDNMADMANYEVADGEAAPNEAVLPDAQYYYSMTDETETSGAQPRQDVPDSAERSTDSGLRKSNAAAAEPRRGAFSAEQGTVPQPADAPENNTVAPASDAAGGGQPDGAAQSNSAAAQVAPLEEARKVAVGYGGVGAIYLLQAGADPQMLSDAGFAAQEESAAAVYYTGTAGQAEMLKALAGELLTEDADWQAAHGEQAAQIVLIAALRASETGAE